MKSEHIFDTLDPAEKKLVAFCEMYNKQFSDAAIAHDDTFKLIAKLIQAVRDREFAIREYEYAANNKARWTNYSLLEIGEIAKELYEAAVKENEREASRSGIVYHQYDKSYFVNNWEFLNIRQRDLWISIARKVKEMLGHAVNNG